LSRREDMGTNIEPSLVQRVAQGLRYALSGIKPDTWMGPGQPLAPVAQEKTEGRAFDYPVGYNLRNQPRSSEAIGFWQLRSLADGYDLLRCVIETRKDQIESYQWEIVPRDVEASADQFKADIKEVEDFLEYPDKEHNWQQWLRLIVEEMLVIDTVCIYPRMDKSGKLYSFELVDGATIKRVIDEAGRTPMPPDPAYQQILKGLPTADYSRDTLCYMMRNPRVWRLYGLSPVEQVVMTVNIALRRQIHQLQFYTEGNVPEAIIQAPETWTMEQIAKFQLWWDSLNEGNTAQRRKMRMVPKLDGIVFPKEGALKDEYDEWLARIICFSFSIAPTALIKQMNRASAEQIANTAKEEGLMPLLHWLESQMNYLIWKYLKKENIRFAFKIVNAVDPKTQAEIHGMYIDRKVLTPDEVREDIGRDALTNEQREEAFPTPVPSFGFGGQAGNDGKPKQPFGGKFGDKKNLNEEDEDVDESENPVELKDKKAATKQEKFLTQVLELVKAQPPTIVEVRPEVNVEVGDTNVNYRKLKE